MKKILGIMAALLIAHTAAFAVEIETALAETAEQFSKTIKTGSTIAIGAMAGAQTVIRGTLKPFGESYLLVIHALNVTTAAVEDIYRAKIDGNETLALLLSVGVKNGSKKVLRADRYHGGELAKLGFGNLLFGTGAYLAGNYVDGAVLTVWHAANLGMFFGGIAGLVTAGPYDVGSVELGLSFLSLGCISGAARIIYGFVRPKYYVKRVKNKSMGAADILDGLNFAIAPLENGKAAVSLGYSLSL